jgi:hypothetical protein
VQFQGFLSLSSFFDSECAGFPVVQQGFLRRLFESKADEHPVTVQRWAPYNANLGYIYNKWRIMLGDYSVFGPLSFGQAWRHVFGRGDFNYYLGHRSRTILLLKKEREARARDESQRRTN